MNPLERIEEELGGASLRVGRGRDVHAVVGGEGDAWYRDGRAGDVASEALDALGLVREDDLLGIDGETRASPSCQAFDEALRETLGLLETTQEVLGGELGAARKSASGAADELAQALAITAGARVGEAVTSVVTTKDFIVLPDSSSCIDITSSLALRSSS